MEEGNDLRKISFEKSINTCLSFLWIFSILGSASLHFGVICPVDATTVFSDGFEGADMEWTGTYTTSGESTNLNCTADPHHGSEHLNATADGSSSPERSHCYKTFSGQSEVYLQAYVKFKTSIPDTSYENTGCLIITVGVNLYQAQASLYHTGSSCVWALNYRNASLWTRTTSAVSPSLDTWYNVVLHWKKGATDGETHLYVDNSTVCSVIGIDTDDDGDANRVHVGIAWTNLDTAHSIYADCVKIDTSFLGPESNIAVSDVGVTSTIAGSSATFYTKWETISGNLSYRVFGCNNTGIWQNETSAFPTGLTESWFNQSKILNNTIGVLIQWQVWANNTLNEWETTDLQNLTTTTPLDTTPPTISVLSPENKTYPENDVPLIFTVNESTSWMGYTLNGQENVSITGNTTIVGLLDGVHTITVYANDTAGNMGSSDVVYFTVDTVSPNIEILSPQNKTYTTNMISLNFTVDEATSWIGYSLDGQVNVTITGNTTLTSLFDGVHYVVVYANDTAGNMGFSNTVYFTVDTISPNIEILSPENMTYAADSIPLTFTVDGIVSWIGYSLDGQANVTITGNTTLPVLPDGSHNLVVYANDTAGNMGSSDIIYFSIDITPPSISLVSPEDKTYATTSITCTFTIDESVSWIGYSLDGQANRTITGDTLLTGLFDGVHYVVVYANDTAGNMGASNTVHFTVDTTPPSVSILSPENKTYDATNVSLSFTIDESVSWIGYSLDGQDNMTIAENTTLSDLSDGSHNIIIYAKDTVGNTGLSETVYFTIETEKEEPFPTWIIPAIVIILAALGTAVYLLKFRKQANTHAET